MVLGFASSNPTTRGRHRDDLDTDLQASRRSMPRSLTIPILAGTVLALLAACTFVPGRPGPGEQDSPTFTLPTGRTVIVAPEEFDYTGRGYLRWPDGRGYDGEWLDGRPHGHGTAHEPDGSSYTGTWQHGARHGHGEQVMADGSRYVGGFLDGERWGVGALTSAGGVYQGHWRRGLADGEGVFTDADGARYEGGWSAGERSGYGTWTTPDGERYQGGWAGDEFHGYGRSEGPPGLIYEGTWEAGQMHGFGRLDRPDGSRYEGDWQAGKRHGQGREVAADGTIHDGRWEFNQPLGPGRRQYRTGIEITGMWNQETVSSGLLKLPSGLDYAGPLFSRSGTVASPPLLEWLERMADGGDPHARLLLGTLYLDLQMPPPDLDEARRLLSAAAEAGIAEARYRLALTWREADAARAATLLEQAAQQDHAGAHELLGDFHAAGIGRPQNFHRAIEHYERAAAAGSPGARNNLAWLLATARDTRYRDAERAVELIRPVALYFGNWQYLDTLAAAWAAAGKFEQAIATAQKALAAARLAPEADPDDVAALERRLERFRSGKPYVDAR
jgi:TPR repeat protein